MDGWSLAVLGVTGYFAVMILVRLMTRRRDELLAVSRQHEKHAVERGGQDTVS